MTETKLVKVECDHCDGCGWYEGGPTLITTCEKCGGSGVVDEEQEVEIKHDFVIGVYVKDGNRYLTREDVCSKCGCKRGLVKQTRHGKTIEFICYYERSKMVYGHTEMPSCWGAMNPYSPTTITKRQ